MIQKINKLIIFDNESRFIHSLLIVDVTISIFSGYLYSWYACFGTDDQNNAPFYASIVFESIFTISFLLKFITSYVPEGETVPVTNLKEIFYHYKDTDLFRDFVTWMPFIFFLDCSKARFFRLMYLIKAFRITKAIEKFNVGEIMSRMKIRFL